MISFGRSLVRLSDIFPAVNQVLSHQLTSEQGVWAIPKFGDRTTRLLMEEL
ncbi:MAG: hypothetical protein SAJ37_07230 [Oscillatoria sp. PMC 1068.18]|nr:hypothetical protein [Oscillatoria sp. PMC 1076.18]MEC4988525.1 hypothetical protein [Oscillatoria sp. PMC 1068.18]